MATFGVVALLCLFNVVIMRTGSASSSSARSAKAAWSPTRRALTWIARVRIIAIVFSTILAGWGQRLIFVQNMGSFRPTARTSKVGGLYAGAAILVGGASVIRATNTQARSSAACCSPDVHSRPRPAKEPLRRRGHRQYFRVFICYGVIALALVMHAWSENSRRKQAASALRAGGKA